MNHPNKHPFLTQEIDVSPSLHANLMRIPRTAKKLKRQSVIFTIVTIFCVTCSLVYVRSYQEKMIEEQLLETHYSNFGSTLSI